jgi:hypothetical protein
LNYRNYCAIISRALISSPQGGYMVHAANAKAARATAPPSTRHFLIARAAIKIARNSPENNALNFSNRPKRACLPPPLSHGVRSKNHDSPLTHHAARFTTHQSLLTTHAFLIANDQLLETELTPSAPTQSAFLIANVCLTFFSHASLLTHHLPLITCHSSLATHHSPLPHLISIRYK